MWTALITSLLVGAGELTPMAFVAEAEPESLHDSPIWSGADGGASLFGAFAEPPRFGARGSRRWQIQGGFGVGVKDSNNRIGLAGLGASYFMIDNLSFDVELNGLYVNQRGDDALAGNVNLLIRWHFLARDTWSLYGDAGAGMLLATKRVPSHGSRFNFTPQAGLGASLEIARDTRLMTGVRWQHISNATLYSENPGRDSILVYVGVSFGF